MATADKARVIRFGVYEVDAGAGEVRKHGTRLRLQEQPFQVLLALLEKPGEVVTREELRQRLWPADTFVDFDHSLNTAINKLRDVLNDEAANPRFIETLAKRGYRFIAPVQNEDAAIATAPGATQEEALPVVERRLARALFAAAQFAYLGIYVAFLWRFEEAVQRLEQITGSGEPAGILILVSAVVGIALRLYLLSGATFDFAGLGRMFRRLFALIVVLDVLWAMSPFLILHRIGLGLAFGAVAVLLLLPFGQRTLVRMAYRY